MAKVKTAYFCQNCGTQASKWVGKCPSCGEWNTFVEEVIEKASKTSRAPAMSDNGKKKRANRPEKIKEINPIPEDRIPLKDPELNRALGGGLVPGSLTLFGGEPGIGKSTLMLQFALENEKLNILYVSGEESASQIRMRADRIGDLRDNCYILTETSTQNIFRQVEEINPDVIIVDSIQTLHTDRIESSPGSVSQIRETAGEFLRYAKESAVPVFLIGHITKEGSLAGPKVLEHMVDTVLFFEGDRNHTYRLLRSVKNRFGSTNELGIYEMIQSGLRPVTNPSEVLIGQYDDALSGVAIGAMIEGLRPLLIEVQALVSTAAYGTPQRSSTGYDIKRLNMLLAVLEKRCGFKLGAKDVFLNIAGGMRVDDPALDLAVVGAIMSSNADLAIDKKICMTGEIGLSGQIRPVNRLPLRIAEAEKLGYERIIISGTARDIEQKDHKIEVVKCNKVEEALRALFG